MVGHMEKVNLPKLWKSMPMEKFGLTVQSISVNFSMEINMERAITFGKIKTHMMVTGNLDRCVAKVSKVSQMVASAVELSKVGWLMVWEKSIMEMEGCMRVKCSIINHTGRAFLLIKTEKDILDNGSLVN